jgi:hypothetical protein
VSTKTGQFQFHLDIPGARGDAPLVSVGVATIVVNVVLIGVYLVFRLIEPPADDHRAVRLVPVPVPAAAVDLDTIMAPGAVQTIAFQATTGSAQGPARGAWICVNGCDLNEVLRAMTQRIAGESDAGRGLAVPEFAVDIAEPLTRHFTPAVPSTVDVLVCSECGYDQCWGITARIAVGDSIVEWSDLATSTGADRDYGDTVLRFDRVQYEAALRAGDTELRQIPPTVRRDTT